VLLVENRGYTNNAGFGSLTILTNGFLTNGLPILSTQANYVIFTEQTNATAPVKYANPGTSLSLGSIGTPFTNGFEGSVLAGNYRVGTTLANSWTVIDSPADTNTPSQISIINGPGLAHTGDTLLSLGTAGIRRRFPISPGRPYTVRFWARAGKVMDLFSTGVDDFRVRLPDGAVDPHYQLLPGDQTEYPGPEAFVLHRTEPPFTTGRWLPNTAISQWLAPYARVPALDGTGQYVFRTYINMYEQDTRVALIPTFRWAADDQGTVVRLNGISFPLYRSGPTNTFSGMYQLGGLVLGLNVVDFFVNDTNGVEGFRVEANGVNPVKRVDPRLTVQVGGTTQRITTTSGAGWELHEFTYTPTNSLETLDFLTETGEVWVDDVSVSTSGDLFVQPEESFDVFDGERAMGEWRIEVRDVRTGAVLPAAEVLEWNLELTLAQNGNRARYYPNGSLDTFTLRTNQVHYFIIDPCRSATFGRIILTGLGNFDGLEMRADWSGFPSGNSDLEDFEPMRNNENPGQASGRATFQISRTLPAPARMMGKALYVAVYNRFINATNRYELEFISDGDCTPLTPPPVVNPGDTQTGTLPPSTGGGGTNTTQGLFQFNVGSNIRAATITVVSDGDVSAYVLINEPPTTSLYSHFIDANNGSGTETLRIENPNGSPLTPGTWYVRVVNDTALPVNFTVSVQLEPMTPPGQINLLLFPQTGGGLQLQWNSEVGMTYDVLGSNNIASPVNTWTVVATIVATNTRSQHTINPSTTQFQFYTVRQRP
jgi:hypothetical protein